MKRKFLPRNQPVLIYLCVEGKLPFFGLSFSSDFFLVDLMHNQLLPPFPRAFTEKKMFTFRLQLYPGENTLRRERNKNVAVLIFQGESTTGKSTKKKCAHKKHIPGGDYLIKSKSKQNMTKNSWNNLSDRIYQMNSQKVKASFDILSNE